MKNKLTDLNDHLFAQIERLADEDISNDDLEKEIRRSETLVSVAGKVLDNADTMLRAISMQSKIGSDTGSVPKLPKMLEPCPDSE